MEYRIHERTVTLMISGELDHHTLRSISKELGQIIDIYLPKRLIFDMSAVRFMDSSGIGFVLGRYRVVQSYGGNVEVVNLSRRLYSMMKLAGLEKLVTLKTKDRERKKDNETDK